MNRNFVLTARFVVGVVWLYEGLWLKLIQHDAGELRVIATVFARLRLAPLDLLRGVGCVETMLAFGVLAGWSPRLLAGVQILMLVGMDSVGILLGKGTLTDPVSVIVRNLPFLVCILLVGQYDNAPKPAPPPARAKTKKRD